MIKIACWDKHGDEFKRLDRHLGLIDEDIAVIRHRSEEPPESSLADIFFVHEGPWLESIPVNLRERCVLVPCIKLDGHVDYFKRLGFTYSICKTQRQLELWNNIDSVVVPNICDPMEPAKLEEQTSIISLIHDWKHRDLNTFNLAKQIPYLKMYGSGEEQLGYAKDFEMLKTAKFLIHIKNIGYVCNAVVKSISMGVPVITTPSTIPYGYENLLIHDFNAIICSDIHSIMNAIHTPHDSYLSLKNNCLSMRKRLTEPDYRVSSNLKILIDKIYAKHCIS
jgi:hypothetical protein